VDWIEADDYYARLHVGGRTHLIRESLARLEARLPAAEFLRVHRSAIVRLDRVIEARRHGPRDLALVLSTGDEVRVSRHRRERVRRALGLDRAR
jgi:two-component system LytT family response regulator